jgi:hypothetical protein
MTMISENGDYIEETGMRQISALWNYFNCSKQKK